MGKDKLILLGGGGHCISCIDVIQTSTDYEIAGILDSEIIPGTLIANLQVLGTDDLIPELAKIGYKFLITVGQIKSARIRENLYQKVKNAGGELPVIISSTALVSSSAKIEEGTIVMHRAILNAQSEIGKCVIVNTGAVIEHETKIGHFCHLSTTTTINGQVKIGNHCMIGSGTVINNNIHISSGVVLGSASVVIHDISLPGVYVGQPANKKK